MTILFENLIMINQLKNQISNKKVFNDNSFGYKKMNE